MGPHLSRDLVPVGASQAYKHKHALTADVHQQTRLTDLALQEVYQDKAH